MQQGDAFKPEPAAELRPEPSVAAGLALPIDAEPPMGEDAPELVGESPPEHSWVGTAFVAMLYAGGAVSLLFMVLAMVDAVDLFSWSDHLRLIPFSLFPGALMVWLARMIQQFKLYGWGVALVLLLGGVISSLRVLWRAEDVLTIALCMLGAAGSILWILYLWNRRPDFS
jgi:hypothetical protein